MFNLNCVFLGFTLHKDNVFDTIPIWGPGYTINFNMYIKSWPKKGYRSIMHFTATSNSCCNLGDRVPYIETHSNGFMGTCFDMDDKGNECFYSWNLKTKTWHNIEFKKYFNNVDNTVSSRVK